MARCYPGEEKYTIQDLYNCIENDCPNLSLNSENSEKNFICLNNFQKENIFRTIKYFYQNNRPLAQDLINNIVHDGQRTGKLYEIFVYDYIISNKIHFEAQVHVDTENCYKSNSNGYDADGKLIFGSSDSTSIYFEIKSFGISETLIDTLKEKIQEHFIYHIITIEGRLDLATSDIEMYAMKRIDDIVQNLKKDIREKGIDSEAEYSIKEIENLTICAKPGSKGSVSSISELEPYRWAKENELYFIKHGSQFHKTQPYIIFCPFDNHLSSIFSNDNDNESIIFNHIAFRALSRRMFFNLNKSNELLQKHDGKSKPNIKISEVIRKLSAIVFINVEKERKDFHEQTWVYVNPNADNKIPKKILEKLFTDNNSYIDDFYYDNY